MFKKTTESSQLSFFTSPESIYTGKTLRIFEDKMGWHNQFRQQVTNRIEESIFSVLFCKDNGAPNVSIRTMIAMMILKESTGISDHKLFEECRFNILTRSAIGLVNTDDIIPAESTYYLFRKRVSDYANSEKTNLFEVMFAQVTKGQSIEFEVSGKRIRIDSKLISSNIAWLSRYELIHETVRMFYKEVKSLGKIDKETEVIIERLLENKGNKVVYSCSSEEVKTRLDQLGELINKILPLFSGTKNKYYEILQRVFNEQFKVENEQLVVARNKEEISAKSVQSPHDTDCTYRDKGGDKIKGNSFNITESCNEKGLNLIGNVDVRVASTADIDFLQEDIKKVQEIFTERTQYAHADGAYHSPDNQKFCEDNNIKLYLHAIQGAKGRYKFNLIENGELTICDTNTNEFIGVRKIICKNKSIKWRIKVKKGYRYFTQKDIDVYNLRKQIEDTPIEILQKRNNVEATIFQLGYHYSNSKSRYRGLVKHQMWANVRCLWVNFIRILKHIKELCKNGFILTKNQINSLFAGLYFSLITIIAVILSENLPYSEKPKFSII